MNDTCLARQKSKIADIELKTPSGRSFVENTEVLGWGRDVVAEVLKSLAEKHYHKRQPRNGLDPADIRLGELRIKYGSVQ